jgi:hypothetical protein
MYNPERTRLLVLAVIGVFVIGFVAWHFVMSAMRRLIWSRERERRARLPQTVATVERCERITSLGACDMVVSFETKATSYRDIRRVRQRTTAFLSPTIIERVTAAGMLPIRCDPNAPLDAVIDYEQLLGPSGELLARSEYVHNRVRRWNAL